MLSYLHFPLLLLAGWEDIFFVSDLHHRDRKHNGGNEGVVFLVSHLTTSSKCI